MRARNLKPEFFRDRLIATLPAETRWVYQALWIIADDYGTALLDAEQLKADLFLKWPDISVSGIECAFADLQVHGRITVHRVPNGDLFGIIVNWRKHQRPHKPSKHHNPVEGEPVQLPRRIVADTIATMELDPSLVKKLPPARKPKDLVDPYDAFSKEICDALYESWVAQVGAVNYGRFRKALAPAKPMQERGLEAIRLFAVSRSQMNDRERGFMTLEKFSQDIAHWLRLADMPLQNPDGSLTEKGTLVSG